MLVNAVGEMWCSSGKLEFPGEELFYPGMELWCRACRRVRVNSVFLLSKIVIVSRKLWRNPVPTKIAPAQIASK